MSRGHQDWCWTLPQPTPTQPCTTPVVCTDHPLVKRHLFTLKHHLTTTLWSNREALRVVAHMRRGGGGGAVSQLGPGTLNVTNHGCYCRVVIHFEWSERTVRCLLLLLLLRFAFVLSKRYHAAQRFGRLA